MLKLTCYGGKGLYNKAIHIAEDGPMETVQTSAEWWQPLGVVPVTLQTSKVYKPQGRQQKLKSHEVTTI